MTKVIKVEQRLQNPPQFFFVPADEAVAGLVPCVLGILSKQLFVGAVLGVTTYFIWKRVKGERGLHGLLALFYWLIPKEITSYRSYPDSAVSSWSA
ncbi:type IV conjugative transfer system protein TraL [uncultured Tateyamaria sp.]|uniref:type IV conjugative transfer system protein TraL n=1 Tax=uncultured Tateyamaria sp. TaxID=455651 RepID=UPI00262F13CC|nr:type IV conjugative transfer system protein TraL [uncultured Tateyamaria sp.]